MARLNVILLPIFGALSAVIAFAVASPFIETLSHRGIPASDPAAHFSTGTLWDIVEHVVFGALLCGSFAAAITASKYGPKRGILSGLIGGFMGAISVTLANSGSDLLGISIERGAGTRQSILPLIIWAVIVPTVVAFTIALAIGITPERTKRALIASALGFGASLFAHIILGPIFLLFNMSNIMQEVSKIKGTPSVEGIANMSLKMGVPIWEATDIAIGLSMGLIFALSENLVRSATLRLHLGRIEGREWSLDHVVNRVGSAEFIEIPAGKQPGLEPIHAQIVRNQQHFVLDNFGANSAWVNGQPVSGHCYLNHGDQVALGSANFVFTVGKARASAPYFQPQWVPPRPQVQPQPELQYAGPSAPNLSLKPNPQPTTFKLIDSLGSEFELVEGTTSIGRHPTNTLSLPLESSVSRQHAELILTGEELLVKDCGSTNGTSVNRVAIRESVLKPGDQVSFGTVRFSVVKTMNSSSN